MYKQAWSKLPLHEFKLTGTLMRVTSSSDEEKIHDVSERVRSVGDAPEILWLINPRAWVRTDAKHRTGLSDKNDHPDGEHITYIKLDRMVTLPLRSAIVPIPAIFELWSFWKDDPVTFRHIIGK